MKFKSWIPILGFLLILGVGLLADNYTGSTIPQTADVANESLRKINAILLGGTQLNAAQVNASVSAQSIAARANRRGITIRNLDSSITVYVSGSGLVSASNGMPLKAGESIAIDTSAQVWYVAASGTPTIAYLESYGTN